jgi:hypothetical protein
LGRTIWKGKPLFNSGQTAFRERQEGAKERYFQGLPLLTYFLLYYLLKSPKLPKDSATPPGNQAPNNEPF